MNYVRIVAVIAALPIGCNKPGDISVASKTSGMVTDGKPIESPHTNVGISNSSIADKENKTTVKAEARAPLTEKQRVAMADAIKALGRVEAAVQVGVNYQRYGELLIDAKAEFNDAARILPTGELLANISDAMDAYRDAGLVWSYKIQYSSLGLRGFWDNDILAKYKVPLTGEKSDTDSAMQVMWRVASAKLSVARALK